MMDPIKPNSPSPPPLAERAIGLPPMPWLSPPTEIIVSEDDKTLGLLCHLLGIFTGFLGPLVVWLIKKDSSPFLDHHGREALNFQITVMLMLLGLGSVTVVLMFVFVGVFLIPVIIVLQILALIAEIMAAVAAHRGEWHRYPCCVRLF